MSSTFYIYFGFFGGVLHRENQCMGGEKQGQEVTPDPTGRKQGAVPKHLCESSSVDFYFNGFRFDLL